MADLPVAAGEASAWSIQAKNFGSRLSNLKSFVSSLERVGRVPYIATSPPSSLPPRAPLVTPPSHSARVHTAGLCRDVQRRSRCKTRAHTPLPLQR